MSRATAHKASSDPAVQGAPASASRVQAKLAVGRAGDRYEQEADRTADRVVSGQAGASGQRVVPNISRLAPCRPAARLSPGPPQRAPEGQEAGLGLQRQATEEKEEPEAGLQRQAEEEESAPPLQAKGEPPRANLRDKRHYPVLNQVEERLFANKGRGEGLDEETRRQMEVGFGADFGRVRIHTGSDAQAMSRDLGARAFTHGRDIFFNRDQYAPGTLQGRVLLAHELTHVVQQGAAERKIPDERVAQNNAGRNQPLPEPADREARRMASLPAAERAAPSGPPPATASAAAESVVAEAPAAPVEAGVEKGEGGAEEAAGKPNGKAAGEGHNKKKAAVGRGGAKAKGKRRGGGGAVGAYLRKATEKLFQSKRRRLGELAANEKRKAPAGEKVKQAESSVVPPAAEGESRANAGQVTAVAQAEPPRPDEGRVRRRFEQALERAVPATLEEVDRFKEEGRGRVVGEAVKGVVTADAEQVESTYRQVDSPPEPAPPAHEPEGLPEIEPAPETRPLDLGEGLVGEVPPEHTDFSGFESESDELLSREGIEEEQLEMVDEGELAEAYRERKKLKSQVREGPAEVKAEEARERRQVDQALRREEQEGRRKMREQRQQGLRGARSDQEKAKSRLEQQRQQVTDHINRIYGRANDSVKQKLAQLEQQSLKAFDQGQARATRAFEEGVNRRIDAFKRRRYGQVGGSLLWAKDKLFGMDELPEVANIFESEKRRFVTTIDRLVQTITAENRRVVQACREILAAARKEIETYVEGLGPKLRQTGSDAMREIQGKLDALESQIDEKERALQKKLAEKREAAIEAIEKKIVQMKEAMSGLVSRLGNLLLDAMLKFFKWALKKAGYSADRLMGVIDRGKAVVKKVVGDPVGFIKNIVTAVKSGIGLFQKNIKKHLIGGMIGWLTGAMADLPIQLPAKWDLKGILHLVLQILGLTWDRIRAKLVKRIGEPAMRIAETSVDIVRRLIAEGPIALWEMLKEKAAEIKQQVMEGIRNWAIVQLVKQGIIKLVSFLNPAGAIVQAILAIYNTIMFFVENGRRIVEFVKAVFNSIGDIAMGRLSKAAQLVERAMAMTIPIILGFLARLLGLSGIGKTVSNIIRKIRRPIDRVVEKVIDRVVALSKKLLKKGKAGARAVKEKGLAALVWWKQRKTFNTKSGKSHALFFKGKERIIVASNPKTYDAFLKEADAAIARRKQTGEDRETVGAYQSAVAQYRQIRSEITRAKRSDKPQPKLVAQLKELAGKTKRLMERLMEDDATDLLKTEVKYGGENRAGFGTSMVASPLTLKGAPGSSPSSGLTTPVWEKLNQRRHGSSSYYVKGHLLNDNLHGPGNTWKNLTPLSRSGNAQHEQQVEQKVKAAVVGREGVGGTLFYSVVPQYGRSLNRSLIAQLEQDREETAKSREKKKEIIEAERFLPKALVCTAYHIDPRSRKKGKIIVSSYAVNNPIDESHPAKYEVEDAGKIKRNLVQVNLRQPFPPGTPEHAQKSRAVEVLNMLPGLGDFRASVLYAERARIRGNGEEAWAELQKIENIGPKTVEMLKSDPRVVLSGATKVTPDYD